MHGGISKVLAVILVVSASARLQAKDGVETAGDILQFVLPAAAVGLTLEQRDWQGSLEFGESAALTLGLRMASNIPCLSGGQMEAANLFRPGTPPFHFPPLSLC